MHVPFMFVINIFVIMIIFFQAWKTIILCDMLKRSGNQ